MIALENITKKFGDHVLFDQFSLEIPEGSFLVIAGKSGCGKTTLLNMIGGLEQPDQGRILIDGKEIRSRRSMRNFFTYQVGFLFQNFALLEDETVLENLNLVQKHARAAISAEQALEKVGLLEKKDAKVYQLSGGEQQRVSLARALVNNPKVIIADEPTGNVDPEMSHEIVELLTKINNAGTTVIMVTHEHDLVRSFQRRVIVIKNGEVVSDTPDPTHARFESSEPRKETDMFFYEEGTSIDLSKTADARTDEDVFDNLESLADETPAQAAATPEDENGGAAE